MYSNIMYFLMILGRIMSILRFSIVMLALSHFWLMKMIILLLFDLIRILTPLMSKSKRHQLKNYSEMV